MLTYTASGLERQPPDLQSHVQLIFFAIGDQGDGSRAQRQVAAAMEQEAEKSAHLDFILLLGDNFYNRGVLSSQDYQWQEKFEHIYAGPLLKKTPFIAILGNHDHRQNAQAQIDYDLENRGSKRWQMPAAYFKMDFGPIQQRPLLRLIGLDTTNTDQLDEQADFIRQSFKNDPENSPIWRLVAGHHPVRSVSWHGDTESLIADILPAMKSVDIDLYLSGHDHNLQLIAHPNEPIQVVSGGGGKSLYEIEQQNENVRFAVSKYGFVKVALNASKLELTYFDRKGKILYEMEMNR
ncbi:MAG: metallophosphoesterase [Magnetococcales bacterium]|nr:metallophosphoesterase [Magnetococcales bacterium]